MGKKPTEAKAELLTTDDKPEVTLFSVNGQDVTLGGTANISPSAPWSVSGHVRYPANLGVPRFSATVIGTQPKTPTFGAPSGTSTIDRDFSFDLESVDILNNGDFTLVVEANNTTLGSGGIEGGIDGDDAPLHCAGFGTVPPPPPPPPPSSEPPPPPRPGA